MNASSVYVLQVDEFVKHYCYGLEVFVEHAKIEDYRSGLVMNLEPMKFPASGKSVWENLGWNVRVRHEQACNLFVHLPQFLQGASLSLVAIPTIGYIPQFFHPLTCNCAL